MLDSLIALGCTRLPADGESATLPPRRPAAGPRTTRRPWAVIAGSPGTGNEAVGVTVGGGGWKMDRTVEGEIPVEDLGQVRRILGPHHEPVLVNHDRALLDGRDMKLRFELTWAGHVRTNA